MSETAKHTPGPWTVSEARGVNGEFWVVGGEGQDFGLVASVTELSDACLIAAAPELLAALKQCAAVCAGETTHKGGLVAALEAARAAIAKATGATP